jgi:hypothetical protein
MKTEKTAVTVIDYRLEKGKAAHITPSPTSQGLSSLQTPWVSVLSVYPFHDHHVRERKTNAIPPIRGRVQNPSQKPNFQTPIQI